MIKLFKYRDSVFCIDNSYGGVLKLCAYMNHSCVWFITVNMDTELKCKIKEELNYTTNKQRIFNNWCEDVCKYFNHTLHTYWHFKLKDIKNVNCESVWDIIEAKLKPAIEKCLRDYVGCIYDNKNIQE